MHDSIQLAGHLHDGITKAILESMSDAVVVADISGKLILINPAAQRLLKLRAAEVDPDQTFHSFTLFQENEKTPYPENKPIACALH